ncbi:MAG TPA: amino acid ABC transporter ATP-binding protein [Pyrinomonadaceae bacterium]|jgi:ABC-type polar amino acid transport system ATPase subunit|nr:amino acid ABC transporter ATP-binding protein [Pyrinomonadaceae bacterium]
MIGAMIRVQGLRKHFGDSQILKGIDFEVPPQTVLGVIGASGSGKSTLLRCLNGLETIDGGTIECGNVRLEAGLSHHDYRKRVRELRLKVGTVFQHFYLFPHLSVLGNIVEAPVHVLRTPRNTAQTEAYELLESVGLKVAARRYPGSLSGGEQQRVAIARALAMHPALLLLDEPTSALDPRRINSLRALLRTFVDRGHTMIIISHSMGFLAGVADHILFMDGGHVVEHGPAEQVLNSPQDARTKEFLEQAE